MENLNGQDQVEFHNQSQLHYEKLLLIFLVIHQAFYWGAPHLQNNEHEFHTDFADQWSDWHRFQLDNLGDPLIK